MKINELPTPNLLDKNSTYFLINEEKYKSSTNKTYATTYKQTYNNMISTIEQDLLNDNFVQMQQSILFFKDGNCYINTPKASMFDNEHLHNLIQYKPTRGLVVLEQSQLLIPVFHLQELQVSPYSLVFYDQTANQLVTVEISDGYTWRKVPQ